MMPDEDGITPGLFFLWIVVGLAMWTGLVIVAGWVW